MKILLKTTLFAVLICIASSCAKQNVEQYTIETTKKIEISTLKNHMANQINMSAKDISYDEKTQQFSIAGVNQISLQELTQSYKRSL